MAETQWPPRSPHEALLSSPSGRRKLRSIQAPMPLSPSPVRKTISTPSFRERTRRLADPNCPLKDRGSDDEEDEETLRLQLQAIEKKLKLKKLQQAKAKGQRGETRSQRDISSAEDQRRETTHSRLATRKRLREEEKAREAEVHVPLSPPPRPPTEAVTRSPSRVLLGIDKGRRAQDVSLRRPPSSRQENSFTAKLNGRIDSRSDSNISRASARPQSVASNGGGKSYSDRLAEMRNVEASREERLQKIQESRSKRFQVDEAEIDKFKQTAATFTSGSSQRSNEFTREEVLRAVNSSSGGSRMLTSTSNSNGVSRPSQNHDLKSSQASSTSSTSTVLRNRPTSSHESNEIQGQSEFESFSSCHLSKRILPHTFLSRQVAGKKVYLLPDLLREVKSPSFDPPDVDGDWILFGIIASKSNPKSHADDSIKSKEGTRSKFMAITLTDLKWELTLFLFGSAFEKWWKLSEGSLIAILNPPIMPPPQHQLDTGRFSLTLHSSDESLLEIGTARDLGWCGATKRDGNYCTQWVDLRHTQFCEFHINLKVQKTKAGRMEVNTMTGGQSRDKSSASSGRGGRWSGRSTFSSKHKPNSQNTGGAQYDRSTGSDYWVAPRPHGMPGRSAAVLMDEDNRFGPDGVNKEERLRKRLADHEKERDIARRLGQIGNGIGGEYQRTRTGDGDFASQRTNAALSDANGAQLDAESLGLKTGIAGSVKLSPIKRKRGMGAPMAEPMGWSGASRRKGIPASSSSSAMAGREKRGGGSDEEQRVRKKTRFVTSKGIREAGRESLGTNELLVPQNHRGMEDGDIDDELEVLP